MARSFVQQLESVMGSEFKTLGAALQTAARAQTAGAENSREVLDAISALAQSNRNMQENMAQMLKRPGTAGGRPGAAEAQTGDGLRGNQPGREQSVVHLWADEGFA